MPDPERFQLSEQIKEDLARNAQKYLKTLKLPTHGPILYIVDKFDDTDVNILARRAFNHVLSQIHRGQSRYIQFLDFDDASDPAEMASGIRESLVTLNRQNVDRKPITVIYLGSDWGNMPEIRETLAAFSHNTMETWLADSAGVTLDSLLHMEESVPVTMQKM